MAASGAEAASAPAKEEPSRRAARCASAREKPVGAKEKLPRAPAEHTLPQRNRYFAQRTPFLPQQSLFDQKHCLLSREPTLRSRERTFRSREQTMFLREQTMF